MSIESWFLRRQIVVAVQGWLGRRLSRKERTEMFGRLFGNWQTTLIGVVMGAIQLHQGGMNWGNALQAALLAALGLAAKDAGTGSAPGAK